MNKIIEEVLDDCLYNNKFNLENQLIKKLNYTQLLNYIKENISFESKNDLINQLIEKKIMI